MPSLTAYVQVVSKVSLDAAYVKYCVFCTPEEIEILSWTPGCTMVWQHDFCFAARSNASTADISALQSPENVVTLAGSVGQIAPPVRHTGLCRRERPRKMRRSTAIWHRPGPSPPSQPGRAIRSV